MIEIKSKKRATEEASAGAIDVSRFSGRWANGSQASDGSRSCVKTLKRIAKEQRTGLLTPVSIGRVEKTPRVVKNMVKSRCVCRRRTIS